MDIVNKDEIDSLRRMGDYDGVMDIFYEALDSISSPDDVRSYIENYLLSLSTYQQLDTQTVADYLFILAGFINSPAAQREFGQMDANFLRRFTKILIYNMERE